MRCPTTKCLDSNYVGMESRLVCVDSACRGYVAHCNIVGKLERDPRLVGALCRSLKVSGFSISARLGLTCKTEKGPGFVKFRNVHCHPRSLFSGLSCWVDEQLQSRLSCYPHFLKGTEDFVGRISHETFIADTFAVRIAMDHLFMSGSVGDLSCYAARCFECGP